MVLSELLDRLLSRTSAKLRPASRSRGSVSRPSAVMRSAVVTIALVTAMLGAVMSPVHAGDADNDGRDELAVGAPREDVTDFDNAGALWIFDGTTSGPANGTLITEGTSGVAGAPAADDGFANALAWGDFDGDSRDDLAVGVSDQDVTYEDAGAVTVFLGASDGLTTTGSKQWTLTTTDVVGNVAEDDGWGTTIATGDFNGDTYDDLAVGAPYRDAGAVPGGGMVTVLYGSSTGLTGVGSTEWSEDTASVAGSADDFERFGSALAAGDFNNDGRDDLAIGVHESVGSDGNAGAVTVLKGSASGITATGSKQWHQDTSGVPGAGETGDGWGADALATGDFDNNGRDDLAIGAPSEGIGSIDSAGAVTLLKGSSTGLTATGSKVWHANTDGVAGVAEEQDNFGSALAAGDFDNNGRDDLAIGVSGESIGELQFAGAVVVMKGSSSAGLTTSGSKQWHANTSGVPGATGYRDAFGFSLAAGDFNGGGRDDLAIGVPGDGPGAAKSGSVVVLRGSSTGLGTTAAMEIYQGFNAPGVGEVDDGFGTALD